MSNNPKTKAYQKRVVRLGKAIAFAIDWRLPEDAIAETDPSASTALVEAAIRWAIKDRIQVKQMYSREVEREARAVAQLEELMRRKARPTLRLAGGSDDA